MNKNFYITNKTKLNKNAINGSLQELIEKFNLAFNYSGDLIIKDINLANKKSALIYLNGLNDLQLLNDNVLKACASVESIPQNLNMDYVLNNIIYLSDSSQTNQFKEACDEILKGKAVFLIDGLETALILGVDKIKERSIEEPPTSAVLKGPRSGFVESIKTNISQIRKIIASKDLIVEHLSVGKYTQTDVAVIYISSIADKKVISEVKKRIKKINIDGILDSFYISQFLEYRPNSMLKQVGNCEKTDIACGKLLEGRVGILVDGSPIFLSVPYILVEDLQNSDDYYSQHSRATFLRFLRIFGLLITLMLPGMYIAIELHHYKIIPLKFIVTIMNTTQQLPLSPFVEIVFVLLLFEILYEASLRMPRYLGLALSIVGALILGDTATKAGLVSPPAVMIIALSGITLYTLPDISPQLSIIRLLFTVIGGCMGFFGLLVLIMFFLFHLNDFDSYGSAYLAPISPMKASDLKDMLTKSDIVFMKTRPKSIKNKNKIRLRTTINK